MCHVVSFSPSDVPCGQLQPIRCAVWSASANLMCYVVSFSHFAYFTKLLHTVLAMYFGQEKATILGSLAERTESTLPSHFVRCSEWALAFQANINMLMTNHFLSWVFVQVCLLKNTHTHTHKNPCL